MVKINIIWRSVVVMLLIVCGTMFLQACGDDKGDKPDKDTDRIKAVENQLDAKAKASIKAVVKQFMSGWQQGDYKSMWACMDPRLQKRANFESFSSNFARVTLSSYNIVLVVSKKSNTARVQVRSVLNDGSGKVNKTESVDLEYYNLEWRIVKIH